jgi:hypothetical protein
MLKLSNVSTYIQAAIYLGLHHTQTFTLNSQCRNLFICPVAFPASFTLSVAIAVCCNVGTASTYPPAKPEKISYTNDKYQT